MLLENIDKSHFVEAQSRRLQDPVAENRILRLLLRTVTTPVEADRDVALLAARQPLRDALPPDDRAV